MNCFTHSLLEVVIGALGEIRLTIQVHRASIAHIYRFALLGKSARVSARLRRRRPRLVLHRHSLRSLQLPLLQIAMAQDLEKNGEADEAKV